MLGYDKVGPEYVINEAQAKTVRKIFDMYLAGNGSQKIKKQLEKDGDLTAMGKSLWHYATISHIVVRQIICIYFLHIKCTRFWCSLEERSKLLHLFAQFIWDCFGAVLYKQFLPFFFFQRLEP